MKIKVSYGYTFNRGNYESERIDASMELDGIEGYLEADEVHEKLFNQVKEFVWKKGGKL